MTYRLGTVADIPTMVALRKTQLVDEGFTMDDCANEGHKNANQYRISVVIGNVGTGKSAFYTACSALI